MSKISIIISREYTTRVMKKSFILLTFLTPLLFSALILVPIWLSSIKDDTVKEIVVMDKTNLYKDVLVSDKNYSFIFSDRNVDFEKNKSMKEFETDDKDREFVGVLYISKDLSLDENGATLYSYKQTDAAVSSHISLLLNEYVKDEKLAKYNIPDLKQKIEDSKTNIKISTIKINEDGGEKETSPAVAMVLGMVSAFLIYIFIMTYGSQVMNGVVQEKTNRIVEVLISSVKPFELMMGKIIGIALVGLTQFFLWALLTLIIIGAVFPFLGISHEAVSASSSMMSATNSAAPNAQAISEVMSVLAGIDIFKILVLFVVYFLGGYLLYSSLFAAIGAVVDTETDSQQFTAIILVPIMFSIFAATYSIQNPNGPLAFWCSLIPITSPIVMMVRIPFDVPTWQLVLSIAILVLSFIGSTWVAGKIYRTGILMYGKKFSLKEIAKWIRQ